MKIFLFFAGIMIMFQSAFSQKMNVLDCFRLLPDSLTQGYVLKFVNNKWITNSVADYEIDATVDIQNGYIEINDEGTGGGTTNLKVVLYREPDGSPLIAISYSLNDLYISAWAYFLEYKNNKWVIVNDKVLPSVTYKNFMNKSYVKPMFSYPAYSIYYKLPQFGTTITLIFYYDLTEMYCNEVFSDVPETDIEKACKFKENVVTDSLKLYWDKQNIKFYFK